MADFNLNNNEEDYNEVTTFLTESLFSDSYCFICKKDFFDKSTLTRHINAKHLGIPRKPSIMSRKRGAIEPAMEEFKALKKCNVSDDVILAVLQSKHKDNKINIHNAYAEGTNFLQKRASDDQALKDKVAAYVDKSPDKRPFFTNITMNQKSIEDGIEFVKFAAMVLDYAQKLYNPEEMEKAKNIQDTTGICRNVNDMNNNFISYELALNDMTD